MANRFIHVFDCSTLEGDFRLGSPLCPEEVRHDGTISDRCFPGGREANRRCAFEGFNPGGKTQDKNANEQAFREPVRGNYRIFAEMWKRWGYYVDVYAYLETRWNEWVTLDQRVELIRQKFHTYPAIVEFINKFECSLRELAIQSSRLGLSCRLRKLVRTVVEACGRGQLRNELIAVIEVRFGRLINVQRYVRNLDEALWDSSRRRRMNS